MHSSIFQQSDLTIEIKLYKIKFIKTNRIIFSLTVDFFKI